MTTFAHAHNGGPHRRDALCRHERQRMVVALALVAAVAVLVSGCGASRLGGELQSRLLSRADLPAGWSAASASSAVKVTSAPCLSGLAKGTNTLRHSTARFVEGTSIPNMSETLAIGAQTAKLWPRVERALVGCRSATLKLGAKTVRMTIRPLELLQLGRSSAASTWTFTLAGIHVAVDIVLFQARGYGGEFTYADLGAPSPATVTAFARAAVVKASRGSTAPVPNDISIASAPARIAHTHLGNVGYREVGSGPPILLIMGFSAAMEAWDPRFVEALAEHHRVITFDNAGIGKTQALPTPLTIDAMADQTSALIDALHLRSTDVLGWSMGSMIAQALAVRHPSQVRRLVLSAAYPGNGSALRPPRAELNAFESGRPAKVMAALFPANQAAAAATFTAATSSYPPASPVSASVVTAQKQAIDGWWDGSDTAGHEAAKISAPTLIADGEQDSLDPVTNTHRLAALIPDAKLQLYPDASHAFLFQDESSFLSRVGAFLG